MATSHLRASSGRGRSRAQGLVVLSLGVARISVARGTALNQRTCEKSGHCRCGEGYKGESEIDAATFYCPYMPLTTHGVMTDPNTFEIGDCRHSDFPPASDCSTVRPDKDCWRK